MRQQHFDDLVATAILGSLSCLWIRAIDWCNSLESNLDHADTDFLALGKSFAIPMFRWFLVSIWVQIVLSSCFGDEGRFAQSVGIVTVVCSPLLMRLRKALQVYGKSQ
jgi:hypothetical protein